MMLSAILTGAFSFPAFAEGFAAVITVYTLCKGKELPTGCKNSFKSHKNNKKNTGGQKV